MLLPLKIGISIDSEIVGEMFLRQGPKTDIANWIENVVWDYLERTADDEQLWSEAYYDYRAQQAGEAISLRLRRPQGGYHWLVIPPEWHLDPHGVQAGNGFRDGQVRKIDYEGNSYSPSEFARVVANNTSRNAWRDLLIKRPGDTEWTLADDLRRRMGK